MTLSQLHGRMWSHFLAQAVYSTWMGTKPVCSQLVLCHNIDTKQAKLKHRLSSTLFFPLVFVFYYYCDYKMLIMTAHYVKLINVACTLSFKSIVLCTRAWKSFKSILLCTRANLWLRMGVRKWSLKRGEGELHRFDWPRQLRRDYCHKYCQHQFWARYTAHSLTDTA